MSRLVSTGIELDLSGDIPVPMVFAIADVLEPQKRKRNYTKEIELPDTDNNRAFFRSAFSLHVTDDAINFNTSTKTPAFYEKKGIRVFPNATIQLNSVTRLDNSEGQSKLKFLITLFSESVNIFLLLAGIKINEFDWSDYDHTLTQANISATWATAPGSGYYYPLIERGLPRPGAFKWQTIDMIPYVYFREVFIKCLEYAGVTYDSDFIDSDRFKNILFGYGGGVVKALSQADIDQREIEVNTGVITNSQSIYPTNTIQVSAEFLRVSFATPNFTSVVVQDDLQQYDDGTITVQRNGTYLLTFGGELDWIYDVGAMTFLNSGSPQLEIYRNGFIFTSSQFSAWTVVGAETLAISGTTSYSVQLNLTLNAGDVIEFKVSPRPMFAEVPPGQQKENITLDITTNTNFTIDLDCIDAQLTDGSDITLATFIPPIRADKFLIGAIRQSNLYLGDPDIFGVQKIEPLSEFYSQTNQFDDISELIDYSKEFIQTPSANGYAKNILFKYKKNKDHDAAIYLEKFEQEYGDFTYEQGSYFAKGELKIEMPWSTIVPFGLSNGIVLPRFITFDANNNKKPNKGEARIMMRNDLKTGAWTLQNSQPPFSATNYATYPSVHHFDDFEDPSFDLNFWLVEEVFYISTIDHRLNQWFLLKPFAHPIRQ